VSVVDACLERDLTDELIAFGRDGKVIKKIQGKRDTRGIPRAGRSSTLKVVPRPSGRGPRDDCCSDCRRILMMHHVTEFR
jgi:hypothetical protein